MEILDLSIGFTLGVGKDVLSLAWHLTTHEIMKIPFMQSSAG